MQMIRIGLVIALGSVPAAAGAGQQFFDLLPTGQIEFTMPSGNIGCVYTPEGGTPVFVPVDGGPELACDRVEPAYRRFTLGKAGPASVQDNVGDASCCGSPNVLEYGNFWQAGPFYCESDETGLTCMRGQNGFFISRKETTVY